jgi:hypothetical protein
MKMDSNHS